MERKAVPEIFVRPIKVELVDDEQEQLAPQPQVCGPRQERGFLGVLGRHHHDGPLLLVPVRPL